MLTYFDIPEEHGELHKSELESIYQGVETVLKTWAQTASVPSDAPVSKYDSQPVEISLGFLGSFFGILNVRITPEMLKALLDSVKGLSVNSLSSEETLKGFTAILIHRLMVHFSDKRSGNFTFSALAAPTSENRFDLKKMAGGVMVVKSWSVEVRFLMEMALAGNQTRKLTQKA